MSINSEKDSLDSGKSEEVTNGLSFFTADDNESSSDSDSDDELGSKHDPTIPNNEQTSQENKLPSPSTLFATVGKPKFLETTLEPNDVDFHSLSKKYEPLFEYSSVSCPAAETVDLESEERNEASISGAPIKYKAEISETKRHLYLHGKRAVDLATAVESSSSATCQDADIGSKKQKTS